MSEEFEGFVQDTLTRDDRVLRRVVARNEGIDVGGPHVNITPDTLLAVHIAVIYELILKIAYEAKGERYATQLARWAEDQHDTREV